MLDGTKSRPNNRRSPPSDNHWSRLTHITHNLRDRLHREVKTPLSQSRRHCRRLCSVGTQSLPLPGRLPGVRNWTERGRSWCILAARTRGAVTG